MRRTLLLSLLVVGAAVALAIGSYSALAGAGPVTSVAGAVIGAAGADDGDALNAVDADDVDGDDVDGDEDGDDGEVAQQDGEGVPEMVGAEVIAEVIAEQFEGVDAETVLALHADDNGFGKLYKAYLIADASGGTMTVEEVLAAAETDGFGALFQEMASELSALSAEGDGLPKNLGQAISGAKKADKAAAVGAVNDGDEDGGHGPPDHAPAHGWRN